MSLSPETPLGGRGRSANHADVRPGSSGVRRLKFTLVPFGVGIAGALFAAATGRAATTDVLFLTLYTVAGLLVFYVLLNSDRVRRSRDPLLTFPQVIFGIGLVAAAYALITPARGLALQWLVLIIVFDMRRLPSRQMLAAIGLALTLPALALLLTWQLDGRRFSVLNDLVQLGLGCVIVPVLMAVARTAKAVQRRRQAINEQMASVLEQSRLVAIRDNLTGLLNRRHMETLFDGEVRRAERYQSALSVAMVDVDHFKSVNDQYGHSAGDAVLRQLAQISADVFNPTLEYVGRWGGEEFLIVLVDADFARAQQRLSAFLNAVQSHDWGHQGLPNVTFSAGLCEHRPGLSIAAMVEGADQALYSAKRSGRNRIEVHEWPASETAQPKKGALPLEAETVPPRPSPVQLVERPLPPSLEGADKPVDTSSGLSALLFTNDRELQDGLKLALGSACIYFGAAVAVLLHGIPYRVFPTPFGYFLVAGMAASAVLPYTLIRSGATCRLQDRILMMPQIIIAIALGCTVYAVAPQARAVILQMLCGVLVFSSVACSPRQAIATGIAAIALLLTAFMQLMSTSGHGMDVVQETLVIGMSSFILALLTLQSRRFALDRQKLVAKRTALAEATQEVAQLMMKDALTGIGNRQFLMSQLNKECDRHAKTGRSFCIGLLDLDHFKKVNDEFGHQVGDEVLIGFSRALSAALRGTDVLGRWGGEEFLLIFPEADSSQTSLEVLERLLNNIGTDSLAPSQPMLRVTFSAGVARHLDGEPISDLIHRADKGLYSSKARGRNCCTLAPLIGDRMSRDKDEAAPAPGVQETAGRT
ncbi:MAG: hypothetical protein C0487_18020 [Leptothrix sp. (in: Bacteria)]|nr:hypothetical protein [Leptothrix sp. (in: b-proteobacteria)]